MAGIHDLARELGNALARTEEYQALKKAIDAADNDRPLVELRNRIQKLEEQLEAMLRGGNEPDEEFKKSYYAASEELQAMPAFQSLVASQANFEKVMHKVNDTVARGIEEGAQSKIILSS